ncbi:PKD-channel domain-containing protein [Aphelenchoides besseyi]|nr:PKD-channel domain-containing protein [Aphelenchoides besseyi]
MPSVVQRKRSSYVELPGEVHKCSNASKSAPAMNSFSATHSNRHYDDANHPLFANLQDEDIYDINAALNDLPEAEKEYGFRLRRHLQFFFMNPMQKYKLRRQIPFKLGFQVLKVIFVTVQLILFAEMRISHVDFLEDTVTVMRHKFLKDWDHDRDAVTYPPEAGRYAVFSSDGIIAHMAHIIVAYYSLRNESFASFSYDTTRIRYSCQPNGQLCESDFAHIPPIELCIDKLADVQIQNDTYIFDISERTNCVKLKFSQHEIEDIRERPLAVAKYFIRQNVTFKPEEALIISKATLRLNLRTIHFSPVSMDQMPECYLIKIEIEFDNSRHTGQIFVRLHSVISYVNLCNGRLLQVVGIGADVILVGAIDVFVLVLCLASLCLCCRALFKASRLRAVTIAYFDSVLKRKLGVTDRLDFWNAWYLIIVVNDIFIIIGTLCKVFIEFRDFDNGLFTLTGILLGMGALLVYFGLLRYLGFFNQYNILILTLKKSAPSIMRFMVCTIILYAGFLLAGWVIIGPYSIKFRTLSGSSEALFSLLNGDDMFATFYTINDSNTIIKAFGTVYIYVFVTLFIYVVLSLFIAIIMDAYEVVKERYDPNIHTRKSTLQEFLSTEQPHDLDDAETRENFAADRLLRLGDSRLTEYLTNRCVDLRQRLRNAWGPNSPYNNFTNGSVNRPGPEDPVTLQQLPPRS